MWCWITGGPIWRVELASTGYCRQLRVWQTVRQRGRMCGCPSDAGGVRSEPVGATVMEFERPSSAAPMWDAEQTHRILKYRMFMRIKATLERLRQTYPTSLCGVLTWFWCFGDGQHAQFNPTAAMMHQGVHFCLLGVGGFLSPCLRLARLIQRLQLRPGSLCLSAPSHCCRSVPVLLYHPPSSGDWAALVRFWWGVPLSSQAARTHPSRTKRARAWLNI